MIEHYLDPPLIVKNHLVFNEVEIYRNKIFREHSVEYNSQKTVITEAVVGENDEFKRYITKSKVFDDYIIKVLCKSRYPDLTLCIPFKVPLHLNSKQIN